MTLFLITAILDPQSRMPVLAAEEARIVYPQSRTILARKVAKAAEALVSVVLVCFVMRLVVEA